MKKTTAQIIVIAVAILILLNVVLIGLLWSRKGGRESNAQRPIEEVNKFMIRELQFDPDQASAFIRLSKEHHAAQVRNQEDFRRKKFDLNQRLMVGEIVDFDSVSAELANVTLNKEREFYRFFVQVLEICNEDQKRKLQKVFFEATGPPEHGKIPFNERQRSKDPPPPR